MTRPVDCEFYVPQVPVCVASVFADARATTLRSLLEGIGCTVHLSRPGTPGDFLRLVDQRTSPPACLVILGHGTPDGIHFGSYDAPGLDASMLRNECLPAEAIRGRACLPGCVVISGTCHGGHPAMAEAFLGGGARAYIGCNASGPGVVMNMFITTLLYHLVAARRSDREAYDRAMAAVDHPVLANMAYYRETPDATKV